MTQVRWIVLLGLLAGCDDTVFPPKGTPTGTTGATEGWCAVQAIFNGQCLACHSAGAALGGLDLQTDPHAALVGVTSAAYGAVLVDPGNPDGSLLLSKLEGTQGASEGGVMPPTGALPADRTDLVRAWIADGATDVCATTPTTPTGTGYHPPGWADPSSHGLQTKLHAGTDTQGGDCRDCHGADLGGGTTGISCTSCHGAGWETNCTFCHGDAASAQPAPPEDIDDNADPDTISFVQHLVHLDGPRHGPWDCTTCHVLPTDALTAGHLFDDTSPGLADLEFSGGLSPAGAYDGAASCSNLYCHGNGRTNGAVNAAATPTVNCTSCHPQAGLAGRHAKHLGEGIACAECHPDVTGSSVISNPPQHVDGQVQVDPAGTVTFTGTTCSGTCHLELHNNRVW